MSQQNNFLKYLQETLTYTRFTDLKSTTGIPARRLAFIKKDPGIMTLEELKKFASILECDTVHLVHKFGCGRKVISIDEMEKLTG